MQFQQIWFFRHRWEIRRSLYSLLEHLQWKGFAHKWCWKRKWSWSRPRPRSSSWSGSGLSSWQLSLVSILSGGWVFLCDYIIISMIIMIIMSIIIDNHHDHDYHDHHDHKHDDTKVGTFLSGRMREWILRSQATLEATVCSINSKSPSSPSQSQHISYIDISYISYVS